MSPIWSVFQIRGILVPFLKNMLAKHRLNIEDPSILLIKVVKCVPTNVKCKVQLLVVILK